MALRLSCPVADPTITQEFGNKLIVNGEDVYAGWGYPGHNGIDYRAAIGTEILACDDGELEATPEDPDGWGIYVRIRHSWGLSYYAHLSKKKAPASVIRGDEIGLSGKTGFSTGPHLHFGVKVDRAPAPGYNRWSDPSLFLPEDAATDWQEKYLDEVKANVDLQMRMGKGAEKARQLMALAQQLESIWE